MFEVIPGFVIFCKRRTGCSYLRMVAAEMVALHVLT